MNNPRPLVSIIIPNFNNGLYIAQCLDSIFAQTYKNLEIICIDDASTDDSVLILQQYQKTNLNLKLIVNAVNKGVGFNRHTAIMVSEGKYFTTLDSDDFLIDPMKIEKEVELLEKSGESTIAFSDIRLVDSQGIEMHPLSKSNIQEGGLFECILLRKCMIPRDYMMTKSQYVEAGGFDVNIPIYEDWDLKLRLAHKNKFLYTGLKGIAYRRHGAGLSSTNSKNHVRWLKYVFNKNIHLAEKNKRSSYTKTFNQFLEKTFSTSLVRRLLKKLRIY